MFNLLEREKNVQNEDGQLWKTEITGWLMPLDFSKSEENKMELKENYWNFTKALVRLCVITNK